MYDPGRTPIKNNQIAIFVPSLRGGGAERVMVTLANGFAARGLSVDLVLTKVEGPYLREVSDGLRIVDLKASRSLMAIPRLIRYLRQERPSVLLSAMKHANVAALLANALSCARIPIVVSEHSTASVSLASSGGLKSWGLRVLMRATYPAARHVITVSEGVSENLIELLSLDPAQVIKLYNPIVSQELLLKAEEPIDHPWFVPGKSPVILGVGRLSVEKDFKTLIHAFEQVRNNRSARLLILGEGEERKELESLIILLGLDRDVCLAGFVSNPFSYMKRATIFVLSSRWEGLPTVMVEAMACGVPVVSTDCPSGPSEILENGKWGRLVPVGNVDALAQAILDTLDNPTLLDVRKRAQYFSVDRAVDEYLKVLDVDGPGFSEVT